VTLDSAGWVEVEKLLAGCAKNGVRISRTDLDELVRTSDKQRFALSGDGLRIRANQGHSVEVDLQYEPAVPPDMLFHGTATRFLDSIRVEGLKKMNRHHVHLSPDAKTAIAVGSRHGKVIVLSVLSGRMHAEGRLFYRSANGVWLTDEVPVAYLEIPNS
jgi:putative RNA 2'-phosphotransferase